ncbi:MAG: hypothetical protein PHZ19_05530 [Candidatus Thermoplasmatota archaeon]|nr:hypothetical protein [Candidatus Thermoplasmatota archaeon]
MRVTRSGLEVDGVVYDFASPQLAMDFLHAYRQDPSARPEVFGARAIAVVPQRRAFRIVHPWRLVRFWLLTFLLAIGVLMLLGWLGVIG